MSEAFIAFVRSEDQVLLMQRSDEIGDLPGAWDGIYAEDPSDVDSIAHRIEECTGLERLLTYVRSGAARGLAFGKTSDSAARLVEVTPVLFLCEKSDISSKTIYKNREWIDQGRIGEKEYSVPQLGELYETLLHISIFEDFIGQEQNVAKEIRARLSGDWVS